VQFPTYTNMKYNVLRILLLGAYQVDFIAWCIAAVNGIRCLAASQEVAVTDSDNATPLWRSLRPVIMAVKLVVKRRRHEAVTAAALPLCYLCQETKAHNSEVRPLKGLRKRKPPFTVGPTCVSCFISLYSRTTHFLRPLSCV